MFTIIWQMNVLHFSTFFLYLVILSFLPIKFTRIGSRKLRIQEKSKDSKHAYIHNIFSTIKIPQIGMHTLQKSIFLELKFRYTYFN